MSHIEIMLGKSLVKRLHSTNVWASWEKNVEKDWLATFLVSSKLFDQGLAPF